MFLPITLGTREQLELLAKVAGSEIALREA
jgi:hypothetical protein